MTKQDFAKFSDEQWAVIEPVLICELEKVDRYKMKSGRPRVSLRKIMNSIGFILYTGSRWCDLPQTEDYASRSTSHRWVKFLDEEKILDKVQKVIINNCFEEGLVNIDEASVDGSFISGKGGGEEVNYGFKGKGQTVHVITDKSGRPISWKLTGANESEQNQVEPMLNEIQLKKKDPW